MKIASNNKSPLAFLKNMLTSKTVARALRFVNPERFTWSSNIPIRNRLIMAFLAVSVIPVFLMGLISYHIAKGAITTKISRYSVRELTQTVNNLDLVLKKYDDFSRQLVANNDLSKLMETLSGPLADLERFQLSRKLADYFQAAFPRDTGLTVVYYPKNAAKPVSIGNDLEFDKFKTASLYRNAKKKDAQWDYYQDNIVLVKDLKNIYSGVSFGVLAVFVSVSQLDGILNSSLYLEPDLTKKGIAAFPYSIAVNRKGKILMSPFPEDWGKNISAIARDRKIMARITAASVDGEDIQERMKQRDVLINFRAIIDKDWFLLNIAPNSYLYSEMGWLGITAFIIGLLICVVAVFVSFAVALGISTPLGTVMGAMKQAEDGDLSVKVNFMSRDELGQLGQSFNRMIEKMQELILNTKNAVTEVLDHSKILEDSSTQSAKTAEAVAAATEEITNGTIEQTQEAEKASRKMNELAKQIEAVVIKSTEVERLSESARGRSLHSKEVIRQLMAKAQETDQITNTVITDIQDLSSSADEIRNLTEAITGIAEQTNLLALNAAIEAARAGDMGLGFAVVADEVNKLAAQSHQAVKTINGILKSIQVKTATSGETASQAHRIVEEQLAAVQKAQQSFDDIIEAMDHVVLRISDVNENVKQINAVKEDTVSLIMNISAISEEAAASTQEVSASTQEQTAIAEQVSSLAAVLSKTSDKLVDSIAKFKVL